MTCPRPVRMIVSLANLCLLMTAGPMAWAEPPSLVASSPWPPRLPGFEAGGGTVVLQTPDFLRVPEAVVQRVADGCTRQGGPEPAPAPFVVAQVPPRVELALHGDLPHDGRNTTGWSSWGDIGVASDGRVYCSIGDHGDDASGNASAFLYEWNPQSATLRKVVDVNAIGPREGGEPTWAKVHARVGEGPDGWIYFTGTLNDGHQAHTERYQWTAALPGGQLLRYHPTTGQSEVFANLPAGMVTATSLIDRRHNRWWCNLESRPLGDAMYAIDLDTGEAVFHSEHGIIGMNRDFAIAADGAAWFNGVEPGEIWRADPTTGQVRKTNATLPAPLRGTTRESANGYIYGVCGTRYGARPRPGELFRIHVATETVELFGPEWLCGEYTPIVLLSPDERFLYYMPGAHGHARHSGTPVIQYHLATGTRKVLAFLREPMERRHHYIPAGTYGIAISADGRTIYANLNGHAADPYRPPQLKATGFGLTAFVAIHIPEEELRDPE